MKLLVREIDGTSFYQSFSPTQNLNVVAIRPHIYKHNSPSGNLTLQILDENGFLIKSSNTINISTISGSQFFHGYIRFDIDISLIKDVIYGIQVISGGGYSFSESDYVGLCSDYDLRKAEILYTSDFGAIDFEIWIKE